MMISTSDRPHSPIFSVSSVTNRFALLISNVALNNGMCKIRVNPSRGVHSELSGFYFGFGYEITKQVNNCALQFLAEYGDAIYKDRKKWRKVTTVFTTVGFEGK